MRFVVKRRILNSLALLFLVALLAFRRFLTETNIGVTILVAFLIAYLLLSLVWWRCPHCNSYLRKLPLFATHCPYCGNELE